MKKAKEIVSVLFALAAFQQFVAHGQTISYTYDSLNRLTQVEHGNGTKIIYTYDPAGNRLSEVITLNQPPVLDAIGNQLVSEGGTLSFTLDGSDPDGNPLTYSALDLPPGATFNPDTRQFSWTPGFDQAGSNIVTFGVSDGFFTTSEIITIEVANSTTLTVDCTASGLQEVLDLAVGGDTVEIGPGTCTGNFVVPAGVTLQGAGKGLTVISASDPGQPALDIPSVGKVAIRDLTIHGGRQGVHSQAAALHLESCEIREAVQDGGSHGDGVRVVQGGLWIYNCHVHDNQGSGVYLSNGASAAIRSGPSGDPTMIEGNGRHGLEMSNASAAEIRDHTEIGINGLQGILVEDRSRVLVGDNVWIGGNGRNGIVAQNGSSVRMMGSVEVTDNGTSGIFLNHGSRASVEGATIMGNNSLNFLLAGGVVAAQGSAVRIVNSEVSETTRSGVALLRNSSGFLEGSTISSNTGFGVFAAEDSVVRFNDGNTVQNNGNFGVFCADTSSRSGTIPDANVTGNGPGDVNCP